MKNFLIYLSIGCFTYVIYFLFLFIAYDLIKVSFKISSTFSSFLATLVHFFLNYKFTFLVNKIKLSIIGKYLVVVFLNIFIQVISANTLFYFFEFNAYFSSSIGILLSSIIGFNLLKIWVFK